MALLARRAARTLALGTLLVAGGCVLAGVFGGGRELAFSHAIHVQEEGLECINCHEDLAVSDDPGMPPPDLCSLCHEVLDEGRPPEQQVASLFAGGTFAAQHVSALDAELRFSHRRHVGALDEDDCAACHVGVESSTAVGEELSLSMADCTACHADRGVPNRCDTCHTEVGVDRAPQNHARGWERLHGRTFRDPGEATAEQCALCHTESTCAACHLNQAPASHDEHWRLRGHGAMASLDRQTCAVCHQASDCESCHADTAPLSHMGSWGAPRDTHCFTCHQPLPGNGCVVCHKGTPSHQLATPKPSWHTPAMNCRQCHGAGQALPHVDNGDNCNSCHP